MILPFNIFGERYFAGSAGCFAAAAAAIYIQSPVVASEGRITDGMQSAECRMQNYLLRVDVLQIETRRLISSFASALMLSNSA